VVVASAAATVGVPREMAQSRKACMSTNRIRLALFPTAVNREEPGKSLGAWRFGADHLEGLRWRRPYV
jgi:hypothetical protein